jgi:hypothetical protein
VSGKLLPSSDFTRKARAAPTNGKETPAEGPEHQGEQADRGDVGRGLGDGGDGEGAVAVIPS